MRIDAMNTLPAGRYVIGDLCYRDQEDADELFADYQPGKIKTLYDGRRYAYLNTAYGDGSYSDQDGNEYSVDSGTIGIMQYDDGELDSRMGRTFEFDSDFQVYASNGVLHFGHISIDTSMV
jgi:hypothetical protein